MMDLQTLKPQQEAEVAELLAGVLNQFGGAIDLWTVVCVSQRELGGAREFVERQWISLQERVQQLRFCLSAGPYEPSVVVLEQVAKLARSSAELRETFDFFINVDVARRDLEAAVLRLAQLWHEVRRRIWLVGALIPLPEPPRLSLEKEAYFQQALDQLFDQFLVSRAPPVGDAHARNGKA
jgi:hypothetical protein